MFCSFYFLIVSHFAHEKIPTKILRMIGDWRGQGGFGKLRVVFLYAFSSSPVVVAASSARIVVAASSAIGTRMTDCATREITTAALKKEFGKAFQSKTLLFPLVPLILANSTPNMVLPLLILCKF